MKKEIRFNKAMIWFGEKILPFSVVPDSIKVNIKELQEKCLEFINIGNLVFILTVVNEDQVMIGCNKNQTKVENLGDSLISDEIRDLLSIITDELNKIEY
jgi:translation elongation factor EF-1beta